jgi:hypothetical protein
MAPTPTVETTDEGEDYRHVRFRNPDEFDEIRTPEWAANAANSVSTGAEVRTGKRKDSDDWEVQSVLVSKNLSEDKAREQAQEIVEKIEE